MNNILALSTPTIIDIVALCIILLFVFMGVHKGFIRTFISSFGTIASIILAILLSATVANLLEKAFGLITTVSNGISGVLNNIFGEELMNTSLSEASSESLSAAGVAGWLITIILNIQGAGTVDPDTTLNKIIAPVFGYYIAVIIAFVALFIAFKLIFKILEAIAKKAHQITFVKWVDKTLGLVLGLFRALIIIDIAIITIQAIPLPLFQTIAAEIQNAPVTNFIDSINIIQTILNSVVGTTNIIEIITKLVSGA